MISTPTVLILGAGASYAYKFPLARGLLHEVCKILRTPRLDARRVESLARLGRPVIDHWGILESLGFDEREGKAFCDELRHTDYPSVDFFLEQRPEFTSIGKACMAIILVACEDPDILFPGGKTAPDPHWYKYVLDAVDNGTPWAARVPLTIVTFNYDRSLDHYLFTALKTRWRTNEATMRDTFLQLPIVHVHGTLGEYLQERTYEPNVNPESVRLAAKRIVIPIEGAEGRFADAQAALTAAERIYFIGFGFHAQNVRRLGVFETRANPQMLAKTILATHAGIPRTKLEPLRVDVLKENAARLWGGGTIAGFFDGQVNLT